MRMNEKNLIKWIGLAKVISLNDNDALNGANGAYTNVVGLSKTKTEFRNAAKSKLQSMGFKLARLEEVEPLADRLTKFKVSNDILKIAEHLSTNNDIVGFSTFHSYSED